MQTRIRIISSIMVLLGLSTGAVFGQDPTPSPEFPVTGVEIVLESGESDPIQLQKNWSKVTLDVDLWKKSLMLLEPIIIKVKYSNRTDSEFEFYKPSLINDLRLESKALGKDKELNCKVFGFYINGPQAIGFLKPGQSIEETVMLNPGNGLFLDPGEYEIRFFLPDLDKKKWTSKNRIKVKQPVGNNLTAVEFIREHLAAPYNLFQASGKNLEETRKLLEEFVNKFPTTPYNEYARIALADVYISMGETGKAAGIISELSSSNDDVFQSLLKTKEARLH